MLKRWSLVIMITMSYNTTSSSKRQPCLIAKWEMSMSALNVCKYSMPLLIIHSIITNYCSHTGSLSRFWWFGLWSTGIRFSSCASWVSQLRIPGLCPPQNIACSPVSYMLSFMSSCLPRSLGPASQLLRYRSRSPMAAVRQLCTHLQRQSMSSVIAAGNDHVHNPKLWHSLYFTTQSYFSNAFTVRIPVDSVLAWLSTDLLGQWALLHSKHIDMTLVFHLSPYKLAQQAVERRFDTSKPMVPHTFLGDQLKHFIALWQQHTHERRLCSGSWSQKWHSCPWLLKIWHWRWRYWQIIMILSWKTLLVDCMK